MLQHARGSARGFRYPPARGPRLAYGRQQTAERAATTAEAHEAAWSPGSTSRAHRHFCLTALAEARFKAGMDARDGGVEKYTSSDERSCKFT